jgi:hypothetical protein
MTTWVTPTKSQPNVPSIKLSVGSGFSLSIGSGFVMKIAQSTGDGWTNESTHATTWTNSTRHASSWTEVTKS